MSKRQIKTLVTEYGKISLSAKKALKSVYYCLILLYIWRIYLSLFINQSMFNIRKLNFFWISLNFSLPNLFKLHYNSIYKPVYTDIVLLYSCQNTIWYYLHKNVVFFLKKCIIICIWFRYVIVSTILFWESPFFIRTPI